MSAAIVSAALRDAINWMTPVADCACTDRGPCLSHARQAELRTVLAAFETGDIETPARALVAALEAQRDAINGMGHPETDHDTVLRAPRDPNARFHIYDTVGDCATCGGAQYGSDEAVSYALGDLREALGMERRPWEYRA